MYFSIKAVQSNCKKRDPSRLKLWHSKVSNTVKLASLSVFKRSRKCWLLHHSHQCPHRTVWSQRKEQQSPLDGRTLPKLVEIGISAGQVSKWTHVWMSLLNMNHNESISHHVYLCLFVWCMFKGRQDGVITLWSTSFQSARMMGLVFRLWRAIDDLMAKTYHRRLSVPPFRSRFAAKHGKTWCKTTNF